MSGAYQETRGRNLECKQNLWTHYFYGFIAGLTFSADQGALFSYLSSLRLQEGCLCVCFFTPHTGVEVRGWSTKKSVSPNCSGDTVCSLVTPLWKCPRNVWHNQQKNIFSSFWRLDIHDEMSKRLAFLLGLQRTISSCALPGSFLLVSLVSLSSCVLISFRDVSQIRLELT